MKNTDKWAAGLVLAALIILFPGTGAADGGFFYPPGNTMFEDAQHAFLAYDSDNGTERLSILPSFYGDAREFAWVIPVPGIPDLETEEMDLFHGLAAMTEPVYLERDGDWDCFDRGDHFVADAVGPPVEIIDRELVGYYETMTISATEVETLVTALEGWGFLHEDNVDEATPVFQHYVDRSWYFVTVRVDSTAFEYPAKSAPYYWYRQLEPIRLTFPAEEAVYPMRISALSAAENSDIYVYVASDHRTWFDGAETYYAKRIDSDDLKLPYPGWEPALTDNLPVGTYLTKLQVELGPAEMTRDLVIVRAATDDEFRLVSVGGFPWTGLLVFAVPFGIAVKRRFWLGGR